MGKLGELKQKAVLTLVILMLARLGIFIPVLGIDHSAFYTSVSKNNFVNFLNIFSGGGFSTIGIFALGIVPYINASLVMQLLIKLMPQLEMIQKEEGERGRQKITQFTRYLTLGWAILQSGAIAFWVKPYVFNWNFYFFIDIILTLTSGAMIILWFSELITEKGLGNGASLLIFQNIVSSVPKTLRETQINIYHFHTISTLSFVFIAFILMLTMTVLIQEGTRNIPIISARQLNKGTSINTKNYLPLKLNQGGVMPLVFASATMTLPNYVINTVKDKSFMSFVVSLLINSPVYLLLYFALIVSFSQFYCSLILDPDDVSENLKKMGVSIQEIRPGKMTSTYLKKILNRLTFLGSIFLFLIALAPSITETITHLQLSSSFGATSLIILVGVAIDTGKQIQTYIISSEYNNITQ